GEVEIPVLSRRQIYSSDHKGNAFLVQRDEQEELQFTSLLLRQHPDFYEQLNHSCFHLHKQQFLNEAWFLNAFEDWRNQGITILGFNTLKNNKINPYKVSITIQVKSGINWFDTEIDARFGKQKVKLKALHKSIRNKSKFVQLDDGTTGILPAEWIGKFAAYFSAGEVVDETIRTPKINFSDIVALYDKHMLSEEVSNELSYFNNKIARFDTIEKIPVPVELKTTLREYQQQGLNWLSFLDGFGFGACLADDMGLGKTVQVIAFILSQRHKNHPNTNLVVVPTSLIFNWQAEIAKFAPSIKVLTIYGAGRIKNTRRFDEYEIILTSYGTLQSDIRYLKDYAFNYIVLDESQAIKNPDSLRYKTVCLLRSRNKIVLTGTPVENNTYDLYGQLSFACPGLFGSRQQFKELYAVPIDQFKDSKRAAELQQKINPFVLRRTKEQVAQELPDKTEMVIYCEMGEEQRKVYRSTEEEIRRYIESRDTEELPESSMFVLQGITRLRQICNSPQLLKDDVFYGDASSKIEVLMEEIANKAPHHKILIFSQFVGMLDLIRKQLDTKDISYEYLTGQTRNRSSKVESFQNNNEVRVFLISLKAGGTGLNLTEADYVYLVDPWWNPAVENQAIDRSYRIGQKKNVVAVRLICPDTIEDKMMKLQQTKKELASDLIKTDASVFKSLSKA
ncbi:MAG: DEAD/DEAH box helicase, partial [Bacteroidota bacterium]